MMVAGINRREQNISRESCPALVMVVGCGVDKGELGTKDYAQLVFWLQCLENGGED